MITLYEGECVGAGQPSMGKEENAAAVGGSGGKDVLGRDFLGDYFPFSPGLTPIFNRLVLVFQLIASARGN